MEELLKRGYCKREKKKGTCKEKAYPKDELRS